MAPDLPEKLLGIDIDPATERRERSDTDQDAEDEDRVRFVLFGVGEHRLAVPVDDVTSITDVPETVTRVPRTPDAIDGVTDLRGAVTAVIDPTVYFPTAESRSGREQLLLFDSPDDDQSAALRVDDVLTVDTVPESNVLTASDLTDRSISAQPLEHPLVTALLERERRTRDTDRPVSDSVGDGSLPTDEPTRTVVFEVVPFLDIDALLAAANHLVTREQS
ncbi:chemotaxis protein CheW [Salinadaptatus halalkaliphilus]|uniref:Chemotaxis protein CheW n=1 Tax=Salinadaptatus halalkaliphilus TaxID=2419781 RepID=A0A4S3TJ07_9EURY|nr:chemotaxis protein CheW [Salinadaptatus halalkaliphilus]THE62845.1 chemotaxis protein CheW [Salinadaptatus halalkaliphilus]